ncbi:MAG: hypothetical protein QXV01_03350 [Candidatus Bathyarchaeia archaeon]
MKTACEVHCPARCIYVGTPDEISRIIGQKAALKIERLRDAIKFTFTLESKF